MLKSLCLAIVALITLNGCTKYSRTQEFTLDNSVPRQPLAADLKQCPDGHQALKDVRIIAGLLWMTPELVKKIENLEVWPAGCSALGNYKTKVVCTQCRFAYDPLFQHWERRSEDPNDFHRPLSPFIRNFPRGARDGKASLANYYQQIRDDHVERESLIYWTRDEYSLIKQQVLGYLNTSRLILNSKDTADARYPQAITFDGVLGNQYVYIELRRHGEMNQTLVEVELLDEIAARRRHPLSFLARASAIGE